MAKTEIAKRGEDDEAPEGADNSEAGSAKQGFVKKLLGNRKLLIIAGGALLVLLAGGGAGYYFLLSGPSESSETQAADLPQEPIVAPQVAFFDVPDIVVNIQTADGSPAYLKLSASLELGRADEKAALEALKPRIVDQFQGYLRELRVDDLKGSAGVLRLKEELLRRVNVAAAPFPVKDVLLKEMIVQ
jgi:flagellar FliL protein